MEAVMERVCRLGGPRLARTLLGAALATAAAGALLLAAPASAQEAVGGQGGRPRMNAQDEIAKDVRLDQKMNAQVPLDVAFRDEHGKSVRLHEYFGRKPVMLVLIQYRCTMLCDKQMDILMESLRELEFTPGKQFNLLVASIDQREGPELALGVKEAYLKRYGRPEAAAGWHFITSDEASIQRLAQSVGFHFKYDAATDQFAHPDGVIVLTPEGKVARYYVGLDYPARDLKFGLMEAASGKIGSPLDAIALLCFHYNPVTGKYALALMQVLRLAAIATIVLLGGGILIMRLRDRNGRARADKAVPAGQ